jgi:hypothetical protein
MLNVIDFPNLVIEELLIEAAAIVSLLTLLVLGRRHALAWLRATEQRFSRMARRRALSITLIGVLAISLSAALSLIGGIPQPRIHDEFSYLLAADTFVHGRTTNLPHPLWVHFESMHILQQPTYASKYPPAQGLIFALGQLVGGHPIVGVWISTGLACAAVLWMLLGWLPHRWALLGALVVAFHPGILLVWGQSYWGGNVAVIGGALVFGGLRRLMRQPRVPDALLLGIGLAVLANSRPYEGLVATVPAAIVLFAWMLSKAGPPLQVSMKRIVLPTAGVLSLTAGIMGLYNSRVTGNGLQMPYMAYEAAYAIAPFLLWQSPRPVPWYRHEILRFHHFRGLAYYAKQQSLRGLAEATAEKVKILWKFYQGSRGVRLTLTLPLIVLAFVWRNSWVHFALLTCSIFFIGLMMETWGNAHYAAPITSLVCMLVIFALRQIHSWRRHGWLTGRLVAWTLVMVALASFTNAYLNQLRNNTAESKSDRAMILAQLNGNGERHLVIVQQKPLHPEYRKRPQEWVYNEADIDAAKIVWARELTPPSQNRKLLEYFKDRKVWLLTRLESDLVPKLVPYPVE